VVLKERRRLLLVPRETPYSEVHLKNMLELTRLGAVLLPASPSFYGKPQSISDLLDTVVGRLLDHLGFEHGLTRRWGADGLRIGGTTATDSRDPNLEKRS
jgi:4-hydroxy-3-polyprenylbenzoate decarboxylase